MGNDKCEFVVRAQSGIALCENKDVLEQAGMNKVTEKMKKAANLVRNKDYEKAAEAFLEVVELASDNEKAWYGLGTCCLAAGSFDEAEDALSQAKELGHPKADKALNRVEKRRGEKESGAATAQQKAQVSDQGEKKSSEGASAVGAKKAAKSKKQEQGGAETETKEGKVQLEEKLSIMLVVKKERDKEALEEAIGEWMENVEILEGTLRDSGWATIVGVGQFDVAILDWDQNPNSAKNLVDFLSLKKPDTILIVLSQSWNHQIVQQVIRGGADYCLIKASGYEQTIPFIIEQCYEQRFGTGDDDDFMEL